MRSDIAQGSRHVPLRRLRAQTWQRDRTRATPSRSAASWSIRTTRTWCWSPRSGIPTAPTRCAVYSARPTAAGPGSARSTSDSDTGAIDLAAEPGRPEVVYAALWQTRRPPWNVYPPSNGPGSGLYKSHGRRRHLDGAATATACPNVPAASGSPSHPRCRSASSRSSTRRDGGLYRSEDGGASWQRVSDDRRIWKRGWYFGGVTVDPRNADVDLHLQYRALPLHRRRPALSFPSRARRGATTITSYGSIRTIPRGGSSASTRARSSRSTAVRPGAPGTTSPPASSIT